MKRIRPLVGIVVLAAVGAGLWFWRAHDEAGAADQLVLYGNVDIRQIQLAFNNSERIASLLVQEGDPVEAGQLLAVLETQRFDAKAAGKEARVAAQREVVARLEAGNRPEEISKAKADLAVAEAQARNAQLTYQRVTNLQAEAVLSPQSLDDATATLAVTEAKLSAARQTCQLMVLGPRKEDIDSAKATLRAYEADLALARRELTDTRLHAPTNGVIRDRLLEPGDMASPQKPVLTLVLDDPLWVRAYVSETDLGRIRPGMKAEVTTDTYPGKHYEAWIGFISPTAEFTPKSVETAEVRTKLVYQVRAFVRNPQRELRLGMPAAVTIPLETNEGEAAARTQSDEAQ